MNFRINRTHRIALAECIRQYVTDELTVDELFDGLVLVQDSDDTTVRTVVNEIFLYFEDDYEFLELTKPGWDQLQRFLLVIESNRHMFCHTEVRWSTWQLVAAAGVLGFIGCWALVGFVNSFVWLAIPFSVLSTMIVRYSEPHRSPYADVIYPFNTFSQLSHTYDEVRSFRKMKYPRRDKIRFSIKFPSRASTAHTIYFWAIIFPTVVFLPFQMLPRIQRQSSVL